MKNIIIVALATGAFASVASADWTDYYSIGDAGASGKITHPSGLPAPADYTTALDPVDGGGVLGKQGTWTFSTKAPPANPRGQFQRTPGLTIEGNATGFSLTVLGTPTVPGGGLSSFEIQAPELNGSIGNNTDHIGYGKTGHYGYNFSWNLIDKPGTTAWWVDANGKHFFDLSQDTGSQFFDDTRADEVAPPDTYGFFIQGLELNTLQIQGWTAVPEPSSIVMGLVTLVGAACVGYRRYRSSKV